MQHQRSLTIKTKKQKKRIFSHKKLQNLTRDPLFTEEKVSLTIHDPLDGAVLLKNLLILL